MFEICEKNKRELSDFLKKIGYSNKNVEMIELHFHPNGDLSFVKPKLRF